MGAGGVAFTAVVGTGSVSFAAVPVGAGGVTFGEVPVGAGGVAFGAVLGDGDGVLAVTFFEVVEGETLVMVGPAVDAVKGNKTTLEILFYSNLVNGTIKTIL